jgi:hypothetical protein
MTILGTEPTNSESSYDEYGRLVCLVRKRVRCWIPELEKSRKLDVGFMAVILALRVMVEAAPHVAAMLVPKGEVDVWQSAYLGWLDRVVKRLPVGIDVEQLRANSLAEFEKLRELGVPLPKVIWAADVNRDLKDPTFRL